MENTLTERFYFICRGAVIGDYGMNGDYFICSPLLLELQQRRKWREKFRFWRGRVRMRKNHRLKTIHRRDRPSHHHNIDPACLSMSA